MYNQALQLNFDNQLAQKKINNLKSKIPKRLKSYKDKTERFISQSSQRELMLNSWVLPALKICNEKVYPEYYKYFSTKKQQLTQK
jgi:hypothetical protein